MSHYHIYTTEGIVLNGHPTREANLFLAVFTREFGLIYAHGQGVRKNASKLKHALQDLSLSSISLVKGKSAWRITSAKLDKSFYANLRHSRQKALVCANILNVLKKLLSGEEKNEELFVLLTEAFDFLERNNMTQNDINNFEYITNLKVMRNLGYLGREDELEVFVTEPLSVELLGHMEKHKRRAVAVINQSLDASQMVER